MNIPISRMRVEDDQDLVRLRRQGRLIAEAVRLYLQDQTRFITALSEIARNAVQHAGGGTVDFMMSQVGAEKFLQARVSDEGPGLPNVDEVVNERFSGRSDLGLGVAGSKRLVHRFDVSTGDKGTVVTMAMRVPSSNRDKIQTIAQAASSALAEAVSEDPHEELVRQNRALVESLAEKDFLIREIHHRVKNNFQLISSLARLQARRAEGEEARKLLESLAVRIRALGLAHEQLYMFEDLTRVGLKSFIMKLCTSLEAAFVSPDQDVRVQCDVHDEMPLTQDEAIDLGIIVNELVTNSIKHAFPDDAPGVIEIASEVTESHLILTISDNGVGNPALGQNAMESESLGMRLLHSSVRKLNGEIEFLSPARGAAVRVSFPRAPERARAFQSVI